jgi:hypothetical protein
MAFSSFMTASSMSGGCSVARLRMFLLFRASFRVARSDATFASLSRRVFSTESMYAFLLVTLIFSALSGALLGSRSKPRSQASAASANLSSAKQAVPDR